MISVKKISLFLFFFLFSTFAFTAPFVMLEKYEGPLLGKLIQLQPVKVYIADARHNRGNNAYRAGHISSDLVLYTQTAFTAWFENVLSLLEKNPAQAEYLRPFMSAIRFGANPANYQYTDTPSEADIKIYYTVPDTISKECGGGAGGCYKLKSKTIWAAYPEELRPPYGQRRTIIHEIGHAFALDDMYSLRFLKKKTVGSGLQDSIMNVSTELTCDDADGLMVALLRTRGTDPQQEDINMPSFCTENRSFEGGYMAEQEDYYQHRGGARVIYANCKGNPVKPQLEVRLNNPQNIFKVIGDKRCIAHLIPQENFREISEQDRQLYPHLLKQDNLNEKIFYKPLLKGSSGMDLFVHVRDGAPYLFYILDKDSQVVLMSADIGNGTRWVYEYPFSIGAKTGTERCMYGRCNGASHIFIYSHDGIENSYVLTGDYDEDNKALCAHRQEECSAWQVLAEKNRLVLAKKYNLKLVFPEGGWASEPQEAWQRAQNWQKTVGEFFGTHLATQRKELLRGLGLRKSGHGL